MIIFFSDISGLDEDKIQQYKAALRCPVEFVSPYQHLVDNDFDKNYQTFCQHVGMDKYCTVVKQRIAQLPDTPYIAVGESVGATALWCNTPMLDPKNCLAAICLYGSRIRDHLAIKPNCPTHLRFSNDEGYFLTPDVNAQLAALEQVSVDTVALPHGFATPMHQSFNPSAFADLIHFIKGLTVD